jgi:hypothetical protein
MPANPRQCQLNAARCLVLAKSAGKPEAQKVFIEMAELWNRLAALTECDQTRLQAISEIEPGELCDALRDALRLRFGEYA